jgi:preprotein translocase subunit SecY
MAKDGANGQKKINAITRYLTVALAIVTSVGYSLILKNGANGQSWLVDSIGKEGGVPMWFAMIVINACFCAGASLVMWLAELINERGIGNGISVILCVNIIASFPSFFSSILSGITEGTWWVGTIVAVGVAIVAVAAIGFIVFVTNSERRIPIQYAKRVVGRKMYGGQATNLPIKLNMTGVMPIIFASSIVSIPATIATFIPNQKNGFVTFVNNFFGPATWEYLVVFLVLTVAFSYFYVLISFNPVEVANNINSNGGAIPGHRPGRPTVQYINRILKRVTLIGAFFLCIVAGVPMLVTVITSALATAGVAVPAGLGVLTFSGSSLLIVVGVVLETIRDLEAQLSMRQSKGFLG